MRKGMKPEVYKENGKLYGFNLGADFVAEHEFGIRKLKDILGVDMPIKEKKKCLWQRIFSSSNVPTTPSLGVDKRTITKFPEECILFGKVRAKNKSYWALICERNSYEPKLNVETLKRCNIYPNYDTPHIFSAWDEESFEKFFYFFFVFRIY
jgi:hypothetical protein